MTIDVALKNIGCPVCHPPYEGDLETYITYQLIGQGGVLYANGVEVETYISYSIDIFCAASFVDLMLRVKAALELAGYVVTVEMEYYDRETKQRQVSLTASIEAGIYG